MSELTPNIGLTLSGDVFDGSGVDADYRAKTEDPTTIERWLMALASHGHTGGTRLASPAITDDPTVAIAPETSGLLRDGTTYYWCYSLVDQYGLETAASDEVALVLPEPVIAEAPDVFAMANPTGTLAENTYFYAVTLNMVTGNESGLSIDSPVTLTFGEKAVEVEFAALPAEGVSWNVWRKSMQEDGYTKVAENITSVTWVDNGVASDPLAGTWDHLPPVVDPDAGSFAATITLPVGLDLTGVKAWRLYRTTESGVYDDSSLVHEVVETVSGSLLTTWTDIGGFLMIGAPTHVSQTFIPPGPIRWVDENTTGDEWTLFVLDGALKMRNQNGVEHPVGSGTGGGGTGGTAEGVVLPYEGDTAGRKFKVVVTDAAGTLGTVMVEGPAAPGTATTGLATPTGRVGITSAVVSGDDIVVDWDEYTSRVEWRFGGFTITLDGEVVATLHDPTAVTYTFAGLADGTYTVGVAPTGFNPDGTVWSSPGPATERTVVKSSLPLRSIAPTGYVPNISLVNNGDNTVTLTWDPYEASPAEDFDKYLVRMSDTWMNSTTSQDVLLPDTSVTIPLGMNPTSFTVVAASETLGFGPAEYRYDQNGVQHGALAPQHAPTGVAAVVTNVDVAVSWDAYVPAANEDVGSFEVRATYPDETYQGDLTFTGDETSYTLSGLQPGPAQITVRGVTPLSVGGQPGPWSAPIDITLSDGTQAGTDIPAGSPTGLTAVDDGSGGIYVTWDAYTPAAGEDFAGYEIAGFDAEPLQVSALAHDATVYPTANGSYDITVAAWSDDLGAGPASAPVTVAVTSRSEWAGGPSNVVGTPDGAGGGTVTWDAPAQTGLVDHYQVSAYTNTYMDNIPTADTSTSFTFPAGTFQPGETVNVSIFAVDAHGNYSDPASGTFVAT